MHKQISIALAAGLLMAGVSVASATEKQQPFGAKTSTEHNIYADHMNAGSIAKGQQHAALGRAPWHNVD